MIVMKKIEDLVGFNLRSCSFGIDHYSFSFEGKIGDSFYYPIVSVMHNLTFDPNNRVDVEREFSTLVWGILETDVVEVILGSESDTCIFKFENGRQFMAWAELPVYGELLIVKDRLTEAWFVV